MSLPVFTAVALILAAAPASEARQLAQKQAWDELYLRFSPAKPAEYSAADRKAIGQALAQASGKLEGDAALALACAEKAAEFSPSAEAWLAAGNANLRMKQTDAAAASFDKALKIDPKQPAALLARADLALQEGDPAKAVKLYGAVPTSAQEHTRAEEGLANARIAEQELAKTADLRKAADEEAAIEKLSAGEVCRETALALCATIRRCLPKHPQAGECDAKGERACEPLHAGSQVQRKDLEACVSGIRKVPCAKFTARSKVALSDLVPACRVVEAGMPKAQGP